VKVDDGGSIAHVQNFVVVKIALFDAAAVYGDGAFERGRQAEIDGAFHLRLDAEGIHGGAAIDGAGDAMDSNAAVRGITGDFGDLRDVAAPAETDTDTTRGPARKRLAQPDFSAASSMTRRRRPMSRVPRFWPGPFFARVPGGEQKLHGIAASSVGRFVEEARKCELVARTIDGRQ